MKAMISLEPEKMPEKVYFLEPIKMMCIDKIENWLLSTQENMQKTIRLKII